MPTDAATKCERILIVDDHPLFRNGLRQLLAGQHGFVVCGEAGTLADARRLYDEFKPELIILDLGMPDGDGLDFLEESRGWASPPKVLILTLQPADCTIAMEAMRIGAAGFLCKEAAADHVLTAVQAICSGQTHLSPELIERLIRRRG